MSRNPLPKPRGSNRAATANDCHGTATKLTNVSGLLPLTANATATTACHTPLFRVAVVTVRGTLTDGACRYREVLLTACAIHHGALRRTISERARAQIFETALLPGPGRFRRPEPRRWSCKCGTPVESRNAGTRRPRATESGTSGNRSWLRIIAESWHHSRPMARSRHPFCESEGT